MIPFDLGTAVTYVLMGLIGGTINVLMPPIVTDRTNIVQRVVLGAIAGFIGLLTVMQLTPDQLNSIASYVATIGGGYAAIDGIMAGLGKVPLLTTVLQTLTPAKTTQPPAVTVPVTVPPVASVTPLGPQLFPTATGPVLVPLDQQFSS